MPFYEYECSACKFYVEALQKISDEPIKKCPSCGKQTMQRLISAPVFRLKGAGWYETDFKSDQENKRNLADGGADDKEPAAKPDSDSDEKKVKVRARKAVKAAKKPMTKKPVKKAGRKTTKKSAAKTKPKAKSAKSKVAKKKASAKKASKAAPKKPATKSTKRAVRKK